jgi:hypothetical protein
MNSRDSRQCRLSLIPSLPERNLMRLPLRIGRSYSGKVGERFCKWLERDDPPEVGVLRGLRGEQDHGCRLRP